MRTRHERELAWDELYQFNGEAESPPRSARRNSRALLTVVLLMIGSTFFLKGTLAANISLGSSNFEFGQGVQVLINPTHCHPDCGLCKCKWSRFFLF